MGYLPIRARPPMAIHAASLQGPAMPLFTHPDFFRLELTLRLPGSLVQAKNTEFTVSLAVAAATRC